MLASTDIKLILGSKREQWEPSTSSEPGRIWQAFHDPIVPSQSVRHFWLIWWWTWTFTASLSIYSHNFCCSSVPKRLIKHVRRAVRSRGVEACCCRCINVSGSFCCCEVCHLICSTNKDNLLSSVYCREYCFQPLVFCVLIDIWLKARRWQPLRPKLDSSLIAQTRISASACTHSYRLVYVNADILVFFSLFPGTVNRNRFMFTPVQFCPNIFRQLPESLHRDEQKYV